MAVEGQDPRHREFRRFMDQHAARQAQDDRVGIVSGKKLALGGGCRNALPVLVLAAHEDAAQIAPLVIALLDTQRHPAAQFGEFADLDRRAERARPQFEAQPFIGVARIRLDKADDREVEQRQREGKGIGYAHQPSEAHPHPAQHVEFARRREAAEGEQDAEHQPDRDAKRQIFGDKIGEHPPHDAHRTAFGRDEIEQAQHLFQHQQHGRKDQRTEHGKEDEPRDVTVDGGQSIQSFVAPSP